MSPERGKAGGVGAGAEADAVRRAAVSPSPPAGDPEGPPDRLSCQRAYPGRLWARAMVDRRGRTVLPTVDPPTRSRARESAPVPG